MLDMKIQITGLAEFQRTIRNAEKQARYSMAVALTRAVKKGEQDLQGELKTKLDNPTPWVAKGTFIRPATKATLTAAFGMRDRQSLYVKEHFEAGRRGQKPFEKVLKGLGVLPAGYRTVPGSGLKLDSRGNPNRAQLAEIIGSLSSRMKIAKGRGKRMALVGYFAVMPGLKSHLAPGIYWRSRRELKPVLIFVSVANYRKRIDILKLAEQLVREELPRQFSQAFEQAMKTAR